MAMPFSLNVDYRFDDHAAEFREAKEYVERMIAAGKPPRCQSCEWALGYANREWASPPAIGYHMLRFGPDNDMAFALCYGCVHSNFTIVTHEYERMAR